jgi:glycosyltransferase involved in cell wall biosynthesis
MEDKKLKIIHVIPYHPLPSSFIFAKRQVEDLTELGYTNEVFFFKTAFSLKGFFSQLKTFRKLVEDFKPNLIHAHYGTINAFFASRIKNVPFVVSFQGSDMNYTSDVHWIREKLGKFLSKKAAQRAQQIICVSERLQDNLPLGKEKSTVVPSGINTKLFKKINIVDCKKQLNLKESTNYIFFNANNPIVKRLDIAEKVVELLQDLNVELLSLNGNVTPNEIPVYLNASVATLLCSDSEGSPMVIKEAMACGLPIVSVDVGDVKSRIENVDNCFVVPQNATDIAQKIRHIIESNVTETNGLEVLIAQGIDYLSVVKIVEGIYLKAIKNFS